jgi:hypothetical protein
MLNVSSIDISAVFRQSVSSLNGLPAARFPLDIISLPVTSGALCLPAIMCKRSPVISHSELGIEHTCTFRFASIPDLSGHGIKGRKHRVILPSGLANSGTDHDLEDLVLAGGGPMPSQR